MSRYSAHLLGWALACGCAGASAGRPGVVPPPLGVPEDAVRSGWVASQVTRGLPAVVETLSARGAAGFRALRIHRDELDAVFTPAGRARIERSFVGPAPGPGEARWSMLSRLRGSAVTGWCARGVRVAEGGGAEGFQHRTVYVERLLVVAREPGGGEWGMWLEGLMLTGAGWRMLPWVPYDAAVETPRRDHSDIALWACDLELRRAPRPPG